MTRKDYVALAEALHATEPAAVSRASVWLTWSDCCDAIADVLAADNPRFDRERFIKACQGENS